MPIIHMLISSNPPNYGIPIKALCGAEIPSAQPVPLNAYFGFESETTLIECRECRHKVRYFAWVISGEEAKQLEGKRLAHMSSATETEI